MKNKLTPEERDALLTLLAAVFNSGPRTDHSLFDAATERVLRRAQKKMLAQQRTEEKAADIYDLSKPYRDGYPYGHE